MTNSVTKEALKVCASCGLEKPQDDFHKESNSKDGRFAWCKECCAEYARGYYLDIGRAAHLKRSYGITVDDYIAMLDAQGGVCAICGGKQKQRLHVDHNHNTGKVRGLLCAVCNIALAAAEDKEWLDKVEIYLREYDE